MVEITKEKLTQIGTVSNNADIPMKYMNEILQWYGKNFSISVQEYLELFK